MASYMGLARTSTLALTSRVRRADASCLLSGAAPASCHWSMSMMRPQLRFARLSGATGSTTSSMMNLCSVATSSRLFAPRQDPLLLCTSPVGLADSSVDPSFPISKSFEGPVTHVRSGNSPGRRAIERGETTSMSGLSPDPPIRDGVVQRKPLPGVGGSAVACWAEYPYGLFALC